MDTLLIAALATTVMWQHIRHRRLRAEHVRILERLGDVERLLHAAYTEPAQRRLRGEASAALRAIMKQVPA